jgi:hypothetical protein
MTTTTTTPSWSDNVSVVGAQVLARGSTVRGTLDLRAKHGAYIFGKIGRGGTTALSNGVNFRVRRVLNDGTATAGMTHPIMFDFLSQAVGGISQTVSTNAAAGDVEIKMAAVTSIAVGDILCIQDSGGGVTRLEWALVAKLTVASGTGVTLDAPMAYAHTSAQADTIRNKADVFAPFWIDGGSLYECVFDYSDDAAGDSVTVLCLAQTLDSYQNS